MIWVLYGYSMAFTNGGGLNDFVGGFSKALLKGVDSNDRRGHILERRLIPEYVYIVFQMTFACITPCLILGAVAERMKFSSMLVFMALWVDVHLLPDRPHGLVLGRPGCVRQCCEGRRGRNRHCESSGPGRT